LHARPTEGGAAKRLRESRYTTGSEGRPVSPRTPSYRLHSPSGQAVVTLAGKDFYLGKFGSPGSRAEFDRLVAEWLANGRALAPASGTGPPDLTVNELLVAYFRFADG